MLHLRNIGKLASVVGMPPRSLYALADRAAGLVSEYDLIDPSWPHRRPRVVVSPSGPLRQAQRRLHLFMRDRLPPTPYSFGGERGRDARRNVLRHRRSMFAYTTDIRDFFPSIRRRRVEAILAGRLGCEGEVARLMARLCTHGGRLAQGLITSPILASEAARRIDARIGGMCKEHRLRYTRFVDDITISGPFDFESEARDLAALAERIIGESGFATANEKRQVGRIDCGEVTVTGLRVLGGHLDVAAVYLDRLEKDVERHRRYADGGDLAGPLYTRDQLAGRAAYVRSVNRSRGGNLAAAVDRVRWGAVMERAAAKGLIVSRKHLQRHKATDRL